MHKWVVFNLGEFKSRKCSISFSRDYVRKGQKNKKALKNQGFSRLYLFYSPYLVAEVGFEPHDLRVMSPTSYQAALLRDMIASHSRTTRWCRWPGSNRYDTYVSRDFKSRASTYSAIPAERDGRLPLSDFHNIIARCASFVNPFLQKSLWKNFSQICIKTLLFDKILVII